MVAFIVHAYNSYLLFVWDEKELRHIASCVPEGVTALMNCLESLLCDISLQERVEKISTHSTKVSDFALKIMTFQLFAKFQVLFSDCEIEGLDLKMNVKQSFTLSVA